MGVDTDRLIRGLIGGDAGARRALLERAQTSRDPMLLTAAALGAETSAAPPGGAAQAPALLRRAWAAATRTRERQVVAVAAAYLDGDLDRVDTLSREHLVDHPDSILVAWLAACGAGGGAVTDPPTSHPGIQESP
ncbi:MAG: hypothetical protein ACOYBY_01005 [Dermatophilaceae bacterium]